MKMEDMLPTREELIAMGYPYGKAADGIPMGNPAEEYKRTMPDYIVYRPIEGMAWIKITCIF